MDENNVLLGTNNGIKMLEYKDKKVKLPYCSLLPTKEITNIV